MLRALLSLLLWAAVLTPSPVAGETMPRATRVHVRLFVPQVGDAGTARLRGRVSGRDAVQLQRYSAASRRWIRVTWLRAGRAGFFRTTVGRTHRRERYRAVAAGRASPARVVPAKSRPAPDACGPRPVKADGSYWSCSLAEDFTGTELDRSVWMPQTIFSSGTPGAWACYLDDPTVISVHDGALHLTARTLPAPIPCAGNQDQLTSYVAGMVSTYRLFSQRYGRFEARITNTATTSPGLQETFWLWPDDRTGGDQLWPASGEIDVAETYSERPDLAIPFLHYAADDNGGPVPGLNTSWSCTARRGGWSTYTLEWTAHRIEIFVNGRTCLVNTSGDPAFEKPYIVALTQLLGTGTNAYDGRAPLPATMTVDYVRVWR